MAPKVQIQRVFRGWWGALSLKNNLWLGRIDTFFRFTIYVRNNAYLTTKEELLQILRDLGYKDEEIEIEDATMKNPDNPNDRGDER